MLLHASEIGIRGHRQVLSGVRVNIDGSEVVWRSQPRARSSISRYTLEAGSTRLAQKMDTYITSNTAALPKTLERRNTGEPIHVRTYMYVFAVRALVAAATRCGYYSRAAFIREQRPFGHIRYLNLATGDYIIHILCFFENTSLRFQSEVKHILATFNSNLSTAMM